MRVRGSSPALKFSTKALKEKLNIDNPLKVELEAKRPTKAEVDWNNVVWKETKKIKTRLL